MAKKKDKKRGIGPTQDVLQSREVAASPAEPPRRMKAGDYEREMARLHGELVAMQEWVKATGT